MEHTNYIETTANSEWIGAGRYHPDWTLQDWERELERSPDLWLVTDRIEQQSVTRNHFRYTVRPTEITSQHRFTQDDKGNEYILIQPKFKEKDVFWLYDLIVQKVTDSNNMDVYIRRIREVYDTTDGMVFGEYIIPNGRGETISFDGESRHVLGDNSEDLGEIYMTLPDEDIKHIYLAIQNWAYRPVH